VTKTLASSFWRMRGWFQAVWCAVSVDHICPGVSTLVLRTVTDGNVWRPYLLPHAVLQPQLGRVLSFSSVTWTLWRFCSSSTTLFAAFCLTLPSKSISSVLQPSLIGPNSVERSCWTMLGSSQKIVNPNKTVEISSPQMPHLPCIVVMYLCISLSPLFSLQTCPSIKHYNLQSPLCNHEPYTLHHNKLGRLSYHMAEAQSGHRPTGIRSQAPGTLDCNKWQ
jgi:hypothetical protein